jgi:hypothetical protein
MTLARLVGSLGGILQIVGVGLVFWDIAEIERLFHRRPWLRTIADRLTTPLRWLGIRPRRIVGVSVMPGTGSLSMGFGRVRVRQQGTTQKGRIAAVEANLAQVDQELDQLWARVGEQQGELARKLSETEERQRTEIASVHQLVKALNADALVRRIWGGVLIVIGTVLTVAALWLTS